MILNGVTTLILRFSPNSIALQVDYLTMVEGRLIMSFMNTFANYKNRAKATEESTIRMAVVESSTCF